MEFLASAEAAFALNAHAAAAPAGGAGAGGAGGGGGKGRGWNYTFTLTDVRDAVRKARCNTRLDNQVLDAQIQAHNLENAKTQDRAH